LEVGIVVDVNAKREQDRFWLRKIEIEQQLNPGIHEGATELLLKSKESYRVQTTLLY